MGSFFDNFLIDRRLLVRFDWVLFFLALLIAILGILNLYSAGSSLGGISIVYKKQICWLLLGVFLLFLGSFLNYSYIERYCFVFYLFSVGLLVLIFFQGKLISGARRWLCVGSFGLQPSELVKIALIMVLARWFHRKYDPGGHSLKSLFFPFVFVGIPFFLILLQPDLGTSLLLLLVFFSMAVFVKIRLFSVSVFLFCSLFILPFSWNLMKDYQRERLIGFFNPGQDPLGKSYQIIQSKIAVGSGKFFGKGFLRGTQTQLGFVPEKYTDFVFSVFCEEWGFWGALFLLFLYCLFFVRSLYVVCHAKDSFGMILGCGLIALLFWQFTINLGMVLGLLPTVGMTLPLFSYGGSSLVVSMFSIGILININIRRYVF